MILCWLRPKVRVGCGDEKAAEMRWILRLREKAILVGETDGGDADGWEHREYKVNLEGYSVALCFALLFPMGFRPGMLRTTVWTRVRPGYMTWIKFCTYRCTNSSAKVE